MDTALSAAVPQHDLPADECPSPAAPEVTATTLSRLELAAIEQRRAARIFWLLIWVGVVNLFDLGFSLLAHEQRLLVETNPVAALVFRFGPAAVVGYKLALLGLGVSILWYYRRHHLAEAATWITAAFCVVLSVFWYQLYLDVEPLWVEVLTMNEVLARPVTIMAELGTHIP